MEIIRVLQVVTIMDRAGLETMLMNYYRHMDRTRIQFDFLVHRTERGAYDDEIEAMGGRIYRLPRLVPWSRSYLAALDCFFTEHPEYRIVHVHQDCLSSVILRAAQKHGVPVRIAHSHSNRQDFNLKYPIKLFFRQFIPRYATHLFACSKAAGRWMFHTDDFTILPNAIDTMRCGAAVQQRAELRRTQNLSEHFVVGHVGRFAPAKNHGFLLEVFREIHARCKDARLVLVGTGELMEEIKAKAETMGLTEQIVFAGATDDVPMYLSMFDVFVFPSNYEGLGIALVEAQAAGLPCYTSQTVVPQEVNVTGQVQYIPLKAGAAAWAERILADREKTETRTDRAAQVAAAGFDIRKEADRLEAFYSVCNRR